jgi:hypothetical protein
MNLSNEQDDILNGTEVSMANLILNYIQLVISVVGLVLNLLCVIVFTMIIRFYKPKSQMFNYFLMKSICDFIIYMILAFQFIGNFFPLQIKFRYFNQIFFKYFQHYLSTLALLWSVCFEVLATIDCCLSIENKYTFFLTKKSFYLNCLFIFLFFFIPYIGKLFVYSIVSLNGTKFYKTVKNPFYYSIYYRVISSVYSAIRDILGTILLILFNIKIFVNLKKLTAKKKFLNNNSVLLKAIKAEESKAKMVYLTILNSIPLHIPFIIFENFIKFKSDIFKFGFVYYYGVFASNCLYLSYATPFIIYVSFNKVFRRCFLKLFKI